MGEDKEYKHGEWYDAADKQNIRVLPYDKYREIDEYGVEGPPRDLYSQDKRGRMRYAMELLETNARNIIRVAIL